MARSHASLPRSWFAALLISVALTAQARAQQEPSGRSQTLNAEPDGPKLSPEEADRKARWLFERGRQAYAEGQYRDAWDYFRQAYLLSKRPELLYNVGQSADRMRMDREALEAFKLYLKRLPDADNRQEVENRVRWLEERQRHEQAAPAPLDDDPAYAGDDPHAELAGAPSSGLDEDENGEPDEQDLAPFDGQPARSGWYLGAALGLGLLHDSVSNISPEGTIGSATFAGELAVGHQALEPGLVVGGTLMFDWSMAPTLTRNDSSTDIRTANMTMLGPFADFYLDPRQDGWHLFGAVALAWFSLSDDTAGVGIEDATGGALVLGGGYEWPFEREWAIGVLGRLTLAKVDQDTGKHALGILSVLCNATWF